jgi:multicopper oxidase
MNRRQFLRTALVLSGAAAVGGCGSSAGSPKLLAPDDPRVAEREAARTAGQTVRVALQARPSTVDLGGTRVQTWTYDDLLPGRTIRLSRGDVLEATIGNKLPVETSIHWHGLALRNDMDGMPPVTQEHIPAGTDFTYRYVADVPGTYWFHPHTGTQLDRGLYAALIVEDPQEPLEYDEEWVLVLDDWVDGIDRRDPETVLAQLREGMDHGAHGGHHMAMGAVSKLLNGESGDVMYPHHLINGRTAAAPVTHRSKPGRKLRIRIVNAASDTAYKFAVGGHTLKVTHTDGFPVVPVETECVLLGMGERYDVVVTLKDGVFPVVAAAEGKDAMGRALIRTGAGRVPYAKARPGELFGRVVTQEKLEAAPEVTLPAKEPDRVYRLELTGGMEKYDWGINGIRFDHEDPLVAEPLLVAMGERVRLEFVNTTKMWHPMHLHGHTFQVGASGPRKDTVIVVPEQEVVCDFDADNPGQWMIHCHNTYHAESGMMRVLGYTS